MNRLFVAPVILAVTLLAACTPPEPLDFSISKVPVAKQKINCKLQDISVNIETNPDGSEAYGRLPAELSLFREPMQSALQDGLNRSASFDYGSAFYCSVNARILGIKYNDAGITFPVDLYVQSLLSG